MKFSEKLYRLRKREGLSQEELGEQLHVTRQTVSKWELDQTKPDSEKLIEISKLFNISLEELSNEEKTIHYDTGNKRDIDEVRPRKWLLVLLIILAIIIVIVLLNKIVIDKKSKEGQANSWGIFDIFNFSKITSNHAKERFNNKFEFYVGTNLGTQVSSLIDEIITNNKTNEKYIITVIYDSVNTTNPDEIKNIKTDFNTFDKAEISLDYDESGYVNKITIEKIENDISTTSFNNMLEFYSGTVYGSRVPYLLDEVITSNKKYPKHIIKVIYKETSTTDETEIRNLKKNFSTWNSYEIWLDYDANGYVYQVNIEG